MPSSVRRLCTTLPVIFFCLTALILFCSGVARADGFQADNYVTYGQSVWPSDATAVNLLTNDFDTVYASTGGTLYVGIGYNITFTSPADLGIYLPSNGPAGPLSGFVDDETTQSGVYGGDVTALALNVDFSAFGFLPGSSSVPFGDLLLMGFSGPVAGLNGMSVSDFLTLNETALGGGATSISIDDLDPYLQQVNASFATGVVTDFASAHLEFAPDTNSGGGGNGGNPVPTPEPSCLMLLASGLLGLGMLRHLEHRMCRGSSLEG
jgi:hypothetical protein